MSLVAALLLAVDSLLVMGDSYLLILLKIL